jgi:hypothetical protein
VVLRALDNKWLSRAGNVALVIGAVLWVIHHFHTIGAWVPSNAFGVVLMGVGIVLMALPYVSRHVTRPQEEGPYVATGELTNMMGQLKAELEHLYQSEVGRPKAPSESFVITFARYGVAGNEADVKARLTELIENGVIDSFVTPDFLLADPAPGEPKVLRVRWEENGKPGSRSFSEGTHYVLPPSAVGQE